MTRRYCLERAQLVPRPLDETFSFFAAAENLETITPDFLCFQITTPLPIAMHAGTLIDYRLRLFGVPFNWTTRIESFEPNVRFVDTQLRGPYRYWHHLHEFYEVEQGTLIVDRVHYEMPFGVIGRLTRWLNVRETLDTIFDYRRERIAVLLGAVEQDQAVSLPV
ncbi:MAG: SRPBCC family protein [Planctomycetaceae bacterium]|nr:SRPBCC family protein [Planctomycetaceae bacterium]